MAASSRAQVLRLYRALLRESQRFSCYGYRTYAIRRIKDAFRENKNITDSEKIEELLNKAKVNLQVIQRQETLSDSLALQLSRHTSLQEELWHICLVPLIPRRLCSAALELQSVIQDDNVGIGTLASDKSPGPIAVRKIPEFFHFQLTERRGSS
ncbi:LYR motif-containing protein 4 isoform X1 [Agelaius phoeniceus]|uniref:LYR motif-containing protein 4 isoform X1 n=1 Tax=Agelaius phoeniceus TaxID=39638 RepID=UPI0023EC715C|nr:LYR motif-containing protein 4 isoform X1 [Agelaius phoeniceus]